MKRSGHLFFTLFLVSAAVSGGALTAHSHGTAYRVLQEATLAAVQFQYSDGEPMPYAAVQVFGPQDRKMEHQNGRTDGHGRFAFCPTMPGSWVITANDGMGHLCEATVKVDPASAKGKEGDSKGERVPIPVIKVQRL